MSVNIKSSNAFVPTKEDKRLIFNVIASGQFSSDCTPLHIPLTDNTFVFGFISEGKAELAACGTIFRLTKEDAFIINSAATSELEANLFVNTHGYWFACGGTLPDALASAFSIPTVAIRRANVYDTVIKFVNKLNENSVITENDTKALCSYFFDFISDLYYSEVKVPDIHVFSKSSEAEMIRTYIDNSIYSDISLDTVKNHFGITKMHAIRVFKSNFNMTPMQYAIKRRADIAASLLATTDLPIKSISEMLHYSNTQHFSNTFKKIIGTTPNRYRAETKKKN